MKETLKKYRYTILAFLALGLIAALVIFARVNDFSFGGTADTLVVIALLAAFIGLGASVSKQIRLREKRDREMWGALGEKNR